MTPSDAKAGYFYVNTMIDQDFSEYTYGGFDQPLKCYLQLRAFKATVQSLETAAIDEHRLSDE